MFRLIRWFLAILVFVLTVRVLYHPMLIATNRPDQYWKSYMGLMVPASITLAIVIYKVRKGRDWITISALVTG